MGQKVNPTGIRLGITTDWNSTWFAGPRLYADYLNDDLKVRDYLEKNLSAAGVSDIKILRPGNAAHIIVRVARPGVVIGKKGGDIKDLQKGATTIMGVPAHIKIEPVKHPDLEAVLIGKNIAQQIERRIMFRRAMKRAIQSAMRQGALGIKVSMSGRLGGAEIARTEWYREGRVPLHTFRANIDYASATAHTTYGAVGIKVWVYKGDVFGKLGRATSTSDAAKKDNKEDSK